ncbi:MAG: hydroxyacylglutathione hydrolase C-terminal domain-containing protein, partial [Pseudomonadota bacterium]
HTLDMLNFHIASEAVLFAGDTMFVMGCGRLFEGTPEQMFESLKKLGRLPTESRVYCAHEYTVSNGEFAAAQLPDNAAIAERLAEVKALRAENRPTVPTTINLELRTNPFLLASNSAEFARLRKAKDVA